jgi:D-erythronate 2-dehydrogenase
MHIAILGGAGFLGRKLALALLTRGYLVNPDGSRKSISKLTLFDKVAPLLPLQEDSRLETIIGEITSAADIESLLSQEPDVIFHLAAVVSGEAEENFELGMNVNLRATQTILEVCRRFKHQPKFLFSSSVAVFGGDMPSVIQDDTTPLPQSSYGTQKAIAELLINDYSRRGFIDGRVLRLPTIVVRPGKPNRATSSFASSIIREPLQGNTAVCPVSKDTKLWIMSPRKAIESFIHAAELSADAFGKHRTVSLPGLTVSVEEMMENLAAIAGQETVKRISWEPDVLIQRIVGSWPSAFAPKRALALGFKADNSMTQIIQAFIDDDLDEQRK